MQKVDSALAKYEQRGWPLKVPQVSTRIDDPTWATRWVGDRQCWVIDFDTTGVRAPLYSPLLYSSSLAHLRCRPIILESCESPESRSYALLVGPGCFQCMLVLKASSYGTEFLLLLIPRCMMSTLTHDGSAITRSTVPF